MKESFVFYKSWKEALSDVPDDIRLEVYDGIIEYALSGKIPSLKPMAKMAFNFIKNDLDRSAEKYEKTIERNRENGKKGGRPKSVENQQCTETQKNPNNPVGFSETQQNPNDNDNYNVDYNDNYILLEKETKEEKLKKENSENDFDSETVKPETSQKEKSCAKKEKVKPPDLETFLDAGREIYQNELKLDFSLYEFALRAKYESWLDAGWKDGHKKPILTWKTKLRNIIPFLKPIYGKSNSNNANNSTTTQNGNSYGGSKVSGKVSASSILAREARKQFAGDCHSGNQTT